MSVAVELTVNHLLLMCHVMVMATDSQFRGQMFHCRLSDFHVTLWTTCSRAYISVTKQYNLLLAWKMAMGLAESIGSLPSGL